jgi:(p)ppGpp synthase/HD superfamily hydrolase
VLTLSQVRTLAEEAHRNQLDKIGNPYIEHVLAVAAGVAPFGEHLEMAGLLHDVVEDTRWTPGALRDAGVPEEVVSMVEKVTNVPGMPYAQKIEAILADRGATLVKISDNAHNSHPARAALLPIETRARLERKYRKARSLLWPAVPEGDIATIVRTVNPSLLDELPGASPMPLTRASDI